MQDIRTLYRYRGLIGFMTAKRRETEIVRTLLGRLWFVIDPLAQLAIYYFVLIIIFGAGSRYGVDPFVFIMLGLVHYLFFQRAVGGSASAVLVQSNLLLQIRIEPLIFVFINFYRTLQDFLIVLALYVIAFAIFGPPLTDRVLYYPVLLLVLISLGWSGAVIAATLAVFVRDLQNLLTILLRLLMFASPVIYGLDFVPESFRGIYVYNPIATLFSLLHWSLVGGPLPPTGAIVTMVIIVVSLCLGAHGLYNRQKRLFAKAF